MIVIKLWSNPNPNYWNIQDKDEDEENNKFGSLGATMIASTASDFALFTIKLVIRVLVCPLYTLTQCSMMCKLVVSFFQISIENKEN